MCDFTELFGEEIVLLVFSFLPVADLHRAARVNTTWMRIALDQQYCPSLHYPLMVCARVRLCACVRACVRAMANRVSLGTL
jgi:hypothetical protein